jgi:hypothetical protein
MERGAINNHATSREPPSKVARAALKGSRPFRALAAAILVGGPVAAVLFLPGVRVDSEGPMDPASPYPISFKISDANLIPLNGVNVYLEICYAVAAPTPVPQPCQLPYKARLFKAGWRDHALTIDQPFTVILDDFMRFTAPDKLGGADISIIVEYQPWNFPIRQEKEFRFATQRAIDGKLYWIPRSLDE